MTQQPDSSNSKPDQLSIELNRRNLLLTAGVGLVSSGSYSSIAAAQTNDDIIWESDFESISSGNVPSEFAVAGNNDQQVTTEVASSGSQSYEMNGRYGWCWEAIMRKELFDKSSRPDAMRIEGSFRLGDGNLGCHDGYRGKIGWQTVANSNWEDGSGAALLKFKPNGNVVSNGEKVGEYNRNEWVSFIVEYQWNQDNETVTHTCAVRDNDPVTVTRDARDDEGSQIALQLNSGDFTVYWDDFIIKRIDSNNNSAPTAAFEASLTDPKVGEDITFDASGSSDDGGIETYEWDFNDDGTYETTGQIPTTSFESAGEYTVTLRVTDSQGKSDSVSETVSVTNTNSAPTASFDVSPTNPEAGEEITLDATESSDDTGIATYEWDLTDDGTFSTTGQTATTSFDSAGEYTVTLRVTDTQGKSDSVSETISVENDNTPPTASFEISPTDPEVGEEVTLDASASSDDTGIATYEWDLTEDGSFGTTGQTVTTSFESADDYTITLRVTDTDDVSASTEQTLTVEKSTFQQYKEAHLDTATTVDEATVSNVDVESEAQAANQAYTTAVENGTLDESTATEAIRRLMNGCRVTLTVAENIGAYSDGGDFIEDVNLTRSMALPTIQTALSLFTGISSMGQAANSSTNSGLLVDTIIDTAKDQAIGGINRIIKYMLGESADVTSDIKIQASQIAEDLANNTISVAADVNEAIQDAKSQIADSTSVALQTYIEQGDALGVPEVPQLKGTVFEDNPLTLDGGLTLLYESLSVDSVRSTGLAGSLEQARAEAGEQERDINNQAQGSQTDIENFAAISEDTGLASSLIDLFQSPSLYDAATTVLGILSSIVGSISNALATGAGIGGLIEINIRHHIGLYAVIRGERV